MRGRRKAGGSTNTTTSYDKEQTQASQFRKQIDSQSEAQDETGIESRATLSRPCHSPLRKSWSMNPGESSVMRSRGMKNSSVILAAARYAADLKGGPCDDFQGPEPSSQKQRIPSNGGNNLQDRDSEFDEKKDHLNTDANGKNKERISTEEFYEKYISTAAAQAADSKRQKEIVSKCRKRFLNRSTHPALKMSREEFIRRQNEVFKQLSDGEWHSPIDMCEAETKRQAQDDQLMRMLRIQFAEQNENVFNEYSVQKFVMDIAEFSAEEAVSSVLSLRSDTLRDRALISNYGALRGEVSRIEKELLEIAESRQALEMERDNLITRHDNELRQRVCLEHVCKELEERLLISKVIRRLQVSKFSEVDPHSILEKLRSGPSKVKIDPSLEEKFLQAWQEELDWQKEVGKEELFRGSPAEVPHKSDKAPNKDTSFSGESDSWKAKYEKSMEAYRALEAKFASLEKDKQRQKPKSKTATGNEAANDANKDSELAHLRAENARLSKIESEYAMQKENLQKIQKLADALPEWGHRMQSSEDLTEHVRELNATMPELVTKMQLTHKYYQNVIRQKVIEAQILKATNVKLKMHVKHMCADLQEAVGDKLGKMEDMMSQASDALKQARERCDVMDEKLCVQVKKIQDEKDEEIAALTKQFTVMENLARSLDSQRNQLLKDLSQSRLAVKTLTAHLEEARGGIREIVEVNAPSDNNSTNEPSQDAQQQQQQQQQVRHQAENSRFVESSASSTHSADSSTLINFVPAPVSRKNKAYPHGLQPMDLASYIPKAEDHDDPLRPGGMVYEYGTLDERYQDALGFDADFDGQEGEYGNEPDSTLNGEASIHLPNGDDLSKRAIDQQDSHDNGTKARREEDSEEEEISGVAHEFDLPTWTMDTEYFDPKEDAPVSFSEDDKVVDIFDEGYHWPYSDGDEDDGDSEVDDSDHDDVEDDGGHGKPNGTKAEPEPISKPETPILAGIPTCSTPERQPQENGQQVARYTYEDEDDYTDDEDYEDYYDDDKGLKVDASHIAAWEAAQRRARAEAQGSVDVSSASNPMAKFILEKIIGSSQGNGIANAEELQNRLHEFSAILDEQLTEFSGSSGPGGDNINLPAVKDLMNETLGLDMAGMPMDDTLKVFAHMSNGKNHECKDSECPVHSGAATRVGMNLMLGSLAESNSPSGRVKFGPERPPSMRPKPK